MKLLDYLIYFIAVIGCAISMALATNNETLLAIYVVLLSIFFILIIIMFGIKK